MSSTAQLDRRSVIVGSGVVLASTALPGLGAPEQVREAIRMLLGDGMVREGRVSIDVPGLVENGNSVPVTISVDSPMTAMDHVRSILVLSPENPLPVLSRFCLGPRNGKAIVRTTIRLVTSQRMQVVAQMSDGTLWSAGADVEVTTAACFDPT